MANTGGTNGSVTKIVTTASGSTVFVTYPADPGPPPVPEKKEEYDVGDPFLRRFEHGQPPLKVDVDCDANGAVTKVSAHQ